MAVTLRDVAKRAGVSVSAVSHVMTSNTKAGIKPETRERVRQVAREMGYHPSAVARALVRRQTDTLGVVLPPTEDSPLRNSFFSALLEGVLQAATTHSRDIMVFTAHPSWDTRECLGKLRDGRCDGLLLFYQPIESEIITTLLDASVPIVLVGDWREEPRLFCVDVEHEASMQSMTEYLISLGHRRIALFSMDPRQYFVPPRIAGYRQAFQKSHIPVDETLIFTDVAPWEPTTIINPVESIMRLPAEKRPTALICISDDIAALAVTALSRCGLRVPEDISVAGFNDDINAVRQHPLLTTMRQPYEAIGSCAISLVQEQMADSAAPVKKIKLPTELVVRDSTAPPSEALMTNTSFN